MRKKMSFVRVPADLLTSDVRNAGAIEYLEDAARRAGFVGQPEFRHIGLYGLYEIYGEVNPCYDLGDMD